MTGPKISTPKSRETEVYKRDWERKNAERKASHRERFGTDFEDFDDVGNPTFAKRAAPKTISGPELVRALERAFSATGDPIFDDALRAVRSYGLDKGGHKQLRAKTWGDPVKGYLVQVRHAVERKRMSVASAAEYVAAEFGVPGSSFEAVTQDLRKSYSAWRRRDFVDDPPDYQAGDLGYNIAVEAVDGANLGALFRDMPAKGQEQPATSFWRRRFREGTISIRLAGKK